MTYNQSQALNRIYEATRNGLQVESFNVSSKKIKQSTLRMHRRGVLCIPLESGYMGRVLVAIPSEEGGERIESLNVSLSYIIQSAMSRDGKMLVKQSKLHHQDLAIRGCDLRWASNNDKQFLIGEPCTTPDKNGVITPFQVAHAWYPRIETVRQEMPVLIKQNTVIRRQTEIKQISISDYGETCATNSIALDGKESVLQIAERSMNHKYTMGIYSSIREDILTCRLNAFGEVIMEAAEIREEKVSVKSVEILIQQALEHHLTPKSFGL